MLFSKRKAEQTNKTELQDGFTQISDADFERFESITGIMDALDRSQAVIEFLPDGTIITANQNFLSVLGYSLQDVQGQHHRMFVEPSYAASDGYTQFWKDLNSGEFQCAEYLRIGRGGKEVWIQATYNPVLGDDGQVIKVVKFATDISAIKEAQADIQNRSQAVIEFEPDGTIITANQLFLATVGYTLAEIKGKHHRIFMFDEDAATPEYADFWRSLSAGNFNQGEFRRVSRSGEELWLQGAYNPILDAKGAVVRVVKGVANITEQVNAKEHASSVGNSIAQSVTEMSSAIEEISQRVSRTADLAKTAEENAGAATEIVNELNAGSVNIGKVVSLIEGLAEQTNLLALNATIEAARAGESGRGFAVVASEVKELANQTAKATSDISASIEGIQGNINDVVSAIQGIANGVTEVSTNTTGVAASVEEQSVLMSGLSSTAEELISLTS